MTQWYEVNNVEVIPSPALLVYPDRIQHNIEMMIKIAGSADRLWPHVKTHKLPQVVQMQVDYGIRKFKCATIAEAEMVAENGAENVLMAYQLVGPNVGRLCDLIEKFPKIEFSVLVDNKVIAKSLSAEAERRNVSITAFLDIDNGMHRTGIAPGDEAFEIFESINELPNMIPGGLHVYDGHIRDDDFAMRESKCEENFKQVEVLIDRIESAGMKVPIVIAGGSPSFPVHAKHQSRILSPGTVTLWDYGYSSKFPDMNFKHAAVLLTRVVSNPGKGLTCLDLGHKSVASEMPHPRVKLFGIGKFETLTHSEEHLVIKSQEHLPSIGSPLYGIPYHICPTVSLHHEVFVVENNEVVDTWEVVARKRKITI